MMSEKIWLITYVEKNDNERSNSIRFVAAFKKNETAAQVLNLLIQYAGEFYEFRVWHVDVFEDHYKR